MVAEKESVETSFEVPTPVNTQDISTLEKNTPTKHAPESVFSHNNKNSSPNNNLEYNDSDSNAAATLAAQTTPYDSPLEAAPDLNATSSMETNEPVIRLKPRPRSPSSQLPSTTPPAFEERMESEPDLAI